MSDDQQNPPAQPEFGELAPEGWSWNPEANAPHTPETKKAADAAAKAAAKAKAALAAAAKTADQRAAQGAAASKDAASNATVAAKPEKGAKPEKPGKPSKFFNPTVTATATATAADQGLSEEDKKKRAVAMARLQSDRFITWGLLGVAVFSVLSGLGDYVNLTRTLNAAYDQLNTMQPGLNLAPYSNPGLASTLGIAIVMGQAIVIGLTFWWAIHRMKAKKLAFWVPVVGFVVASAVILMFTLIAFFGDPSAVNAITGYLQAHNTGTPLPTPTATGISS